LNVRDCVAVRVFGSESPLIVKPAPEIVARLMTRFTFPLLVSVTLWVLVCPTGMLLKFNEVGEIARMGCVPVPISEIVVGEFDASLVTVRVPVAGVMDVGANWT
jgi:hypothetical protein